MPLRLCKTVLVAAIGLFLLLVVFNNLTDYRSNYGFVSHVLAMDTTFPGNNGLWRALHSETACHAFYAIIILWETAAMLLCFSGARKLWLARTAGAVDFNRAKSTATLGLTLSLLLWFFAFITIGGEWFLMWQSKIWNGQDAAFRFFTSFALVLIFLSQKDADI